MGCALIDDYEDENDAVPDIKASVTLPVSTPNTGISATHDVTTQSFVPPMAPNIDPEPNVLGSTFIDNSYVATLDTKIPEVAPSFLEKTWHAFKKYEYLSQLGHLAVDTFSEPSHLDHNPEGWTPMNEDAVRDLPQQYWPYVTHAVSPADQEARRQKSLDQMHDDERFQDGSILADLIGGGAALITNPMTYFLPGIGLAKYSGVLTDVMLTMGKVAPGVALDALARNSLEEANKIGGNIQDALINSLSDFVFEDLLLGAGKALHTAIKHGQLWESRNFMKVYHEGADINPVVNEKGEWVGNKVSSGKDFNLSAAKVDSLQLYVDQEMSRSGFFSAPVIGKPLEYVFSFASPIMAINRSPFLTAKAIFNRIVPPSVITEGESKGVAREFSAHEWASWYRDQGAAVGSDVKDLFYKVNGMTGDSKAFNALKNISQKITSNQTMIEEEFSKQVGRVIMEKGWKSERAEINEAAELMHDFYNKFRDKWAELSGEEARWMDPRTAFRYMPLNHNIPKMLANPEGWLELTANQFKKQHEAIQTLQRPKLRTKERIESLQERIREIEEVNPGSSEVRDLKNQLAAANGLLEKQHDVLIEELRNNPDHHILLESRVMFNTAENKELNKIREPITKAQAAHEKEIDNLEFLKQRLKENKSATKKLAGRKKLTDKEKALKDELVLEHKDISHELELTEKRITRAKDELHAQEDLLQHQISSGKIDKKFHYADGPVSKLFEPNLDPKFRKIGATDREREADAQQYFDAITHQSPMDLVNDVIGHNKELVGGAQSTKKRTLMVDSNEYNNAGFLDPDITKSIATYAQTMGKHLGFKHAFPEYANGTNAEGILGHFKEENDKMRASILKTLPADKQEKALLKLNKQYQKSKRILNDTYKVYMGTYNAGVSPALLRFSSAMRGLVASAKMGAVPVYQASELSSAVLKFGLMPFLAQGLRPLIKSLGTMRKDEEWTHIKNTVGSCYIAANHISNSLATQLIHSDSMSTAALGGYWGKITQGIDTLSHLSSTLYGINTLQNLNETTIANLAQSEVMRMLIAHEGGTITNVEKQQLARLGIDAKKDAKTFIENYKNAGGYEVSGGHQSLHYKWENAEASQKMSLSIRRAVNDAIINKDPYSKPYILANNPILSMMFMFHGWAFGALTKYTIPIMQRPDAQHLMGFSMAVGLNMMTDPLLRLANGKDPYKDDESWFAASFKAIDYSGMLGPSLTLLQDINKMSGNTILPELQTERAAGQPGFETALGPVYSYMYDGMRVGAHVTKGDMTQGDANRLMRLVPLSNHLLIRKPINELIKSSDLPESRAGTQPWAWWSHLHNK